MSVFQGLSGRNTGQSPIWVFAPVEVLLPPVVVVVVVIDAPLLCVPLPLVAPGPPGPDPLGPCAVPAVAPLPPLPVDALSSPHPKTKTIPTAKAPHFMSTTTTPLARDVNDARFTHQVGNGEMIEE